MQFSGEFVNHLCVGRTHESADPLQILTQFLVCYRRFFAKQEPFRLSEAIGGVMTPPYEVLRNSLINEFIKGSPECILTRILEFSILCFSKFKKKEVLLWN